MSLILITGCKKDDEESAVQDFTMEALTQKSWKPVLTDSNPTTNPQGVSNQYNPLIDCEKDDTYAFGSDGKLLANYNQLLCNGTNTSKKVSYTIDLANKKITIDGVLYQIAELSATRFKYYLAFPASTGVVNLIFMYEH